MILYFSGTGNSAYTAKKIGEEIQDDVLNIFDRIRDQDTSGISSGRPWVVVVPTYAWRIPRIVHEWLLRTKLTGSLDIYFVMTCDGSSGNAGAYLEKLCMAKSMKYKGCIFVAMPENYIALFQTPNREEALKKIEQSEPKILEIAQYIKNGAEFPKQQVTFKDKCNSGIVNDIFYPLFVHADKFYVTNACISCSKCAAVCPLANIKIKNGKPIWGKRCTHCMACISRCPAQAIEYGKHSVGLPRYICPKEG